MTAPRPKIRLRGLPEQYTLILIDGRRQNTAGSVTPNGFGETSTSFLPPVSASTRVTCSRSISALCICDRRTNVGSSAFRVWQTKLTVSTKATSMGSGPPPPPSLLSPQAGNTGRTTVLYCVPMAMCTTAAFAQVIAKQTAAVKS